MLDITGIKAKEGDEVIVFNDVIRVEDIANQIDTIPYEVLTGISERVKRVYFYE
jgi:alanine racemase